MQRGDMWADGIYHVLEAELPKVNVTILGRIRYPPDTGNFTDYLATAEGLAAAAIPVYGINHTAIEILSFEEIVTIVTQAQAYPTIYNLFWFGSDGTAMTQRLIDEAPAHAKKLKIFSTLAGPFNSIKYRGMYDRYYELLHQPLSYYRACEIDIAWVIAQAVLETGSADARGVIRAIPDICSRYFGYSGWCLLNEAGDRYMGDYDIWGYGDPDGDGRVDNVKYGFYNSITGEVTWYSDLLAKEGIIIPGP
jgi:branched-chain amino acid transport system substrate-binding protein